MNSQVDCGILCCLVWLVIKILGKLPGKSVLAGSSHGLGSPGGSRGGFQSDESHQRLWRLSLVLAGSLQTAYEKQSPSDVHFQQLGSKPQQKVYEGFKFYS